MNWTVAFVGLGGNLGDPSRQIRQAVGRLSEHVAVRPLRCSSLYRTEPVGFMDQPWFVNAVVCVLCRTSARELLDRLLEVEGEMGRKRDIPNGPRIIDLDLLLWGGQVILQEGLQVPHPRMHQRGFVLVPMCEVAPEVVHPVMRRTMRGLLEGLSDGGRVEFIERWGDSACG